ncbi:DUF4440 domain-containing protein [Nissabacter sp. SGAir0207]|uniref:DUF4440 domain-containing protein n=1 Tax=Nissabacter sp. SGAir0207 TaxID=2126321 RepID=UPI0010CCF546|nr:DUF4440 domain-containing protein [Nissabacter sp. SGAir0207]QCR38572.1 DUF4440 domain-containing protein [Nissabacter sp. SGAir0207]
MNRYFMEVMDAHTAIEQWLGEGAGEQQALLGRFSQGFSMVTLGGQLLDFSELSAFFGRQRGAKPGLAIQIDCLSLLAEWEGGAVVTYRERQQQPGTEATTRWSSVVFALEEEQPRWRHLHETLQPLG